MGIEIIAGVLAGAGLASGTALFTVGGVAISSATIAAFGIEAGVLVGGTLLLRELQPKQHTNEQQTVKQSSPPRTRVYGQALVGGSYFFFNSSGGTLVSGFIICEGPITNFMSHWFNDQVSPDVYATYGHADCWPWQDKIDFTAQIGYDDQTYQDNIAEYFPWWTPDHRNRSLANVVVRCFLPGDPSKNFQKFFPSGVPTYRCEIQGSPVYDPRDPDQNWYNHTTWRYTSNAALCILDYLVCGRGLSPPIPRDLIDTASFIVMANLCDEQVAYAIGDGGFEARYRLWGMYSLDEQPSDVLARMMKTCDGELYMTSAGTVALRGGQWTAPTFTITADMVLTLDAQRGRDKLARYNQLRIRYVSLVNQYQQIEGDPWNDTADQEASGEVLPQDFDLAMVPSYTQGQRLAKIQMAKDNPEWIFNLTTNVAGLDALEQRVVTFEFPDLGINDTFFVNSFEILEDQQGTTCKIGLGSLSADAYEWSTAEEGNPASNIMSNVATPYIPDPPTGLTLTEGFIDFGGGYGAPVINVSVNPPSGTNYLTLVVQYRAVGASTWSDMTVNGSTAQSPVVSVGSSYEVQVAYETFGGNESSYVTSSIAIS